MKAEIQDESGRRTDKILSLCILMYWWLSY